MVNFLTEGDGNENDNSSDSEYTIEICPSENPSSSSIFTPQLNSIFNAEINTSSTIMKLSSADRKQKSRDALEISEIIHEKLECYEDDDLSVGLLALKQLGIYKKIEKHMNTRKERQLYDPRTDFDTRKCIWDYWHNTSSVSTLTSRPAKLRTSDRPKIKMIFLTMIL